MSVNLASVWNILSRFSPLEGQSILGGLRLICSAIFLFGMSRIDAVTEGGRLDFSCDPNISVVDEKLCFLDYSDEMNAWMQLKIFLLVTAFILVVLWTAMILYSSNHLKKIRGATDSSEREHLCQQFWRMFLLHVSSEAASISAILVFFSCTQKLVSPDKYDCKLNNQVVTCVDVLHREKKIFNIFFILWMLLILVLCFVTFVRAACYKENFIKELLIVLDTTETGAKNRGWTFSFPISEINENYVTVYMISNLQFYCF
ncbi:PREDICTED: uncharacterized protein LOC107357262 [Acropora digitifera]|uniref:uncharacterized protein LOC107357262 n=1 Tax=Acropora digitifera TaxID=70779 RepID=UPI00077A9B66|nr:PREDICTED: uncharacterized protein LOC107357262 [Acropora digitifera]